MESVTLRDSFTHFTAFYTKGKHFIELEYLLEKRWRTVWNELYFNEILANVIAWDRDIFTWSDSSDVIGWDRDKLIFNSLLSEKRFASWRQSTKGLDLSSAMYFFENELVDIETMYHDVLGRMSDTHEIDNWVLGLSQRRGHPASNGNIFVFFQITHTKCSTLFLFLRHSVPYNSTNTTNLS